MSTEQYWFLPIGLNISVPSIRNAMMRDSTLVLLATGIVHSRERWRMYGRPYLGRARLDASEVCE